VRDFPDVHSWVRRIEGVFPGSYRRVDDATSRSPTKSHSAPASRRGTEHHDLVQAHRRPGVSLMFARLAAVQDVMTPPPAQAGSRPPQAHPPTGTAVGPEYTSAWNAQGRGPAVTSDDSPPIRPRRDGPEARAAAPAALAGLPGGAQNVRRRPEALSQRGSGRRGRRAAGRCRVPDRRPAIPAREPTAPNRVELILLGVVLAIAATGAAVLLTRTGS
jgi:hypothetical protein